MAKEDIKDQVQPFRATFSVTNKDGIGALVTIGYDNAADLQTGLNEFENWFQVSGYHGDVRGGGKAAAPSTPAATPNAYPPCPKCGGTQTLSKAGKVYCQNLCWKNA